MQNVHIAADQLLVPLYDDALSDHLQHLDCLNHCLTGLEGLHHYHLAVVNTPEYIQNCTLRGYEHPRVRMPS